MKTSIILVVSFLVSVSASAQISFTYTFDSSVLSVLTGENEILTSEKSQQILDLKNKWRFKATDSVKVDIRGFYLNDEIDSLKRSGIKVKLNIFGKMLKLYIKPDSIWISETISRKRFERNGLIKIRSNELKKRIHDRIILETYDFSAKGKLD